MDRKAAAALSSIFDAFVGGLPCCLLLAIGVVCCTFDGSSRVTNRDGPGYLSR